MSDSSPGRSPGTREAVYEAFTDRETDVETAVEKALAIGRERLDADIGFFTRIVDGTQLIVKSVGEHPAIQPGETCPLDRAYCRRTIEIDGLLSVQDAEASEEISTTAYDTFQLGAYIGSKVLLDDEVYGTVCFATDEPRGDPFNEAQELFVELLARLTGQALERRSYEQTLKAQNERLQAEKQRFEEIAEASFDILFQVETDMSVSFISPSVERVLGYEPGEMQGQSFAEFLTDESIAIATEAREKLLAGESVEMVELTFIDADGDPVYLEINARPIRRDDEVRSMHGVARDVTVRRERELALRVRTRAMEEANIGITIADATTEGTPITYANAAFEGLTGYGVEEAGEIDCEFLLGERSDPETVDQLQGSVAAAEPATVEVIAYRRDGVPFWDRLTVTPVEDETGVVTHFLAFHEDITERKRMEQLLIRLNRVLRHNLRNEMNVMLGQSHTVREHGGEAVADDIEESIEDLLAVAEKAGDLEDAAHVEREPARVDPRTVTERAIESLRADYPDATLSMSITTDRDLCVGTEFADAVLELLKNALQYDTDPPTTVTVEVGDDDELIEYRVVDNGPGIPENEAAVIQSGSETALLHGSGLGLWLVNWIVTRYGGSFQLDRRTGAVTGTVATIRLPGLGPDDDIATVARPTTTLFQ